MRRFELKIKGMFLQELFLSGSYLTFRLFK